MTDNSVRQPDERQKALRAMQLRTAGATYRAIAESLDYADESGARKAVNRLLTRTEHDAVGELRDVEGERLDALQRAAWPAAINGDLDAIKTVLAVIDRRMKLYGLAAPVRVDVGGVSHDEFAVRFVALIEEMEPDVLHDVLGGLPGGAGRALLDAGARNDADGYDDPDSDDPAASVDQGPRPGPPPGWANVVEIHQKSLGSNIIPTVEE